MKLKLYTSAVVIIIVALVSCAGNNDKDYVDKSVVPTAEEKATTPQSVASNPTIQSTGAMPASLQPQGNPVTVPVTNPVIVNPQQPQQLNVSPQNNVVMTPVQTAVQPTAAGMNPPHGQPGHRCDISVGAPLNSKPAPPAPATTTATTVNAQPQVTMTEVANKTKTAPGMNPPHGEPNHRCDIAVGAPLDSKPAPTTVTTATAPAAIAPPPLLSPAKTDSTKN